MQKKNQQSKLINQHDISNRQKTTEECSIHAIELLRFSYAKAFTIGLILIITGIGALLLSNFKKIRKIVFYSLSNFTQATHVYIISEDKSEQISSIFIVEQSRKQFLFKKLRYWITEQGEIPVDFLLNSEDKTEEEMKQLLANGLSADQILLRREKYGMNEHKVDIPNYFSYMISVIFTPPYLLQYFIVVILTVQGFPSMGIFLVAFSLLSTSGNYIALYFSSKKIQQIAQKKHFVRVLRDKIVVEIESNLLVPGDIFYVEKEMACDGVLVSGEAYMNEHSLTGESVPVGKFSIQNFSGVWPDNKWLFEGTVNLEAGDETKAMIIHTGFATRRGRIIRQMLNRVPKQPDFFQKAIMFLIFSGLVAIITYFSTVQIKLNANIDRPLVWFSIVNNFLLKAINPSFPIYFTMAYSWSIYRLRAQNILTTMPEKTVESNRLKISCFDKTGTLTENNILLHKIFVHEDGFKGPQDLRQNSSLLGLVNSLFGTCHTVRQINGQKMGDEVDLHMFNYSQFKKLKEKQGEVYEDSHGNHYEVLKVHQFESKYQSMCVLIHDKAANKYYCFSKGAPEKMMALSTNKIEDYDEFIADLALKGLRTIAFNAKQIEPQQTSNYVNGARQKFSENSQLIGLITFENKLKEDTVETLAQLRAAEIDCKMITGDGIFIAVQTAIRAGIIPQNGVILVLEGRKQDLARSSQDQDKKIKGILLKKDARGYKQQIVKMFEHQIPNLQNTTVAIDGDFLKANPSYATLQNTKIFARITPQQKGKIIKLQKEQLNQQWKSKPFFQRLWGEGKSKVSMTGDGANDLLAIREADVGIGISSSDASYGAAFTVQNLKQQIEIVKEGKCTTQSILQNFRFIIIVAYLDIVVNILSSTEATLLSEKMLLYINYFIITFTTILRAFSKPDPKISLTSHSVRDNFFGLQNHLLIWGNAALLSGGIITGFFYITSLPDYISNPFPYYKQISGFNPECQLVTAMFLLITFSQMTSGILVYKSHPWKQPIYKNIVLMIVIIANYAIIAIFYAANKYAAGFLNTVELPSQACLFLFFISTASQILALGYSTLILKTMLPKNEKRQIKEREAIDSTNLTISLMSENI